jgi:hypothetical protein
VGTVTHTREHLLRHCSRWKYQYWELSKKVTGWKVGWCQRAQVLELLSMEICNKAVMDFLAAMDVRKFPLG